MVRLHQCVHICLLLMCCLAHTGQPAVFFTEVQPAPSLCKCFLITTGKWITHVTKERLCLLLSPSLNWCSDFNASCCFWTLCLFPIYPTFPFYQWHWWFSCPCSTHAFAKLPCLLWHKHTDPKHTGLFLSYAGACYLLQLPAIQSNLTSDSVAICSYIIGAVPMLTLRVTVSRAKWSQCWFCHPLKILTVS